MIISLFLFVDSLAYEKLTVTRLQQTDPEDEGPKSDHARQSLMTTDPRLCAHR